MRPRSSCAPASKQLRKRHRSEFVDDRLGFVPRLAVQSGNQTEPDALERLERIVIAVDDVGREHRLDVVGQTSRQLVEHPLFRVCSRDGRAFVREVMVERGDHSRSVERQLLQSFVEIEQVASLPALKERPKLVPNSSSGSNDATVTLPLNHGFSTANG